MEILSRGKAKARWLSNLRAGVFTSMQFVETFCWAPKKNQPFADALSFLAFDGEWILKTNLEANHTRNRGHNSFGLIREIFLPRIAKGVGPQTWP